MPRVLDVRAADGSRMFGSLPETYDAQNPQWHALRAHVTALPGVSLTSFVTDDVTEAWVDFDYRGHRFAFNNQHGEWWFFVDEPACPDDILREVLEHCEAFLDPAAARHPGR